jgi:hypothetical protein
MKRRDLILASALFLVPALGRAQTPCPPAQFGVEGGTSVSTPCPTASSGAYSTNFPAAENPISEGGKWVNGGGLDWQNVQTTTNKAFGTGFTGGSGGGSQYDDNLAHIAPAFRTFANNQFAQGVVYRASGYSPSNNHEVELLLRFSLTQDIARGYEILYSHDGWIVIVRWNGPLGNYTELASSRGPVSGNAADGDVIRAEITGGVIKVYKNGALALTGPNDTTWSSGQPGIGFWIRAPGTTIANYGWKSFTAGDQ